MDRLKDKVAIVTGSTSGIGIGIARLFAAEGAKVVICGRREEKGQAVVDNITKEGGESSYHFFDITNTNSIEKLIDDTAEKYGKIDILVNNAANVYWDTLYFAYHAPLDTDVIRDIKKCFKSSRNTRRFFKKYNILKHESFLGRCSTKIILYSTVYKRSIFFSRGESYK